METPSVCAIIPAHNSQTTLARALSSVRAQTLPASQVIVVDDASTDSTAHIASTFQNLKVEVLRLTKNIGAAGARNRGIAAATTELVAFLDADDEWLPTKLEKQVAVIASDAKISFVSCGSDLISPDGLNLGNVYPGQSIITGSEAWKSLLYDDYITTPSVLVWRAEIQKVGCFSEVLKIAEDQDMWIRLAESGNLGYVHESLVHVHEQPTSLSAGPFSDQLTYTLPMIQDHITRLSSRLSGREIRDILGRRFLRVGQLAFHLGSRKEGRTLIWRSIFLGYRPWEGFFFLATSNRFARCLKQKLLRR